MKKLLIFLLSINISYLSSAQEMSSSTSSDFNLGNGLTFKSGDSYLFKLSGMIQPSFSILNDTSNNTEYFFNSKHTFFSFSGFSKKERVSFLMLADFSLASPLLDAWISYHLSNNMNISFGQKLITGNNREMCYMEDNLQFSQRSLLSQTFSRTGREFGLFVDLNYSFGEFYIRPNLGVTSGDGRSSFGSNSRDIDYGGFKYFGRIDFYPLGYFSSGNNLQISDIKREKSPKLVFGIAASYNDGASHSLGEGHGAQDIIDDGIGNDSTGGIYLYNVEGLPQLPDYRKIYFDLLFKFQGFSFLGEYVNTSALSFEQVYTDNFGSSLLAPTQISEYFVLGSGLNLTLGYVFKSNFGIDLRYSNVSPEFESNSSSIISSASATTVSFSKYFLENNFKVITSFSNKDYTNETSLFFANLILQLKL